MKIWRVWFHDTENGIKITCTVMAKSFDDAIAKAREFDSRINAAQIVKMEQLPTWQGGK